jgi:hypothetical protein
MEGILSGVISTSRWVGRYIAPPSLQPGEARVEMPIVPHAAIFTIGACDPAHGRASDRILRLHPEEER